MRVKLSGRELRRRALEATGWTDIGHCRHPTLLSGIFPKGARHDGMCDAINGRLAHLPAVESDAGISEPWFMEWCEKNKRYWSVSRCTFEGRPEMNYFEARIEGHMPEPWRLIIGKGATPSEARARAVVAATEEQKG